MVAGERLPGKDLTGGTRRRSMPSDASTQKWHSRGKRPPQTLCLRRPLSFMPGGRGEVPSGMPCSGSGRTGRGWPTGMIWQRGLLDVRRGEYRVFSGGPSLGQKPAERALIYGSISSMLILTSCICKGKRKRFSGDTTAGKTDVEKRSEKWRGS